MPAMMEVGTLLCDICVISPAQLDLSTNINKVLNVIRYVRLGTNTLRQMIISVLNNVSRMRSMLKIITHASLNVQIIIRI